MACSDSVLSALVTMTVMFNRNHSEDRMCGPAEPKNVLASSPARAPKAHRITRLCQVADMTERLEVYESVLVMEEGGGAEAPKAPEDDRKRC